MIRDFSRNWKREFGSFRSVKEELQTRNICFLNKTLKLGGCPGDFSAAVSEQVIKRRIHVHLESENVLKKKAIILGGSSGIGKATAERFAREGWSVAVAAPEADKGAMVIENLPGSGHLFCRTDVREDKDLQALQALVTEKWGTFDVLVNSIGVGTNQALVDGDYEVWNNIVKVIFYGAVKACRTLLPQMNDGGRIIHITSVHHERVAAGRSAYAMSKAALTQMTRSLALELAPRGILSNAIAPGFINTPSSIKADGKNELESDWFIRDYVEGGRIPLRRPGQPEEVAGVVWFLAGPDASYMTGTVLTVDGGMTITF